MKIDIIITAFNEDHNAIVKTVEACLKQESFINMIYLIDDCSIMPIPTHLFITDKVKILRLSSNIGISAARNIALKFVKAPFVAIINIEVLLPSNWIEVCLSKITQPNTAAVFSSIYPEKKSILSSWRMRFQEQKYNTEDTNKVNFAPGHAVLFRTEALKKIKGYNEEMRLIMEDYDISCRLKNENYDLIYVSSCPCKSIQKDTIENLSKKQNIRMGFGYPRKEDIYKYFKSSSASLINRLARNFLMLRWLYIPLDILIYLIGLKIYLKKINF